MPRLPQPEIARRLVTSRAMLYPGFEDETFCLAAAEAICSGVPVISEGIGSLSERVRHGETGILCSGDDALAGNTVNLLRDDALWWGMQPHCRDERSRLHWSAVADKWIKYLSSLSPNFSR